MASINQGEIIVSNSYLQTMIKPCVNNSLGKNDA